MVPMVANDHTSMLKSNVSKTILNKFKLWNLKTLFRGWRWQVLWMAEVTTNDKLLNFLSKCAWGSLGKSGVSSLARPRQVGLFWSFVIHLIVFLRVWRARKLLVPLFPLHFATWQILVLWSCYIPKPNWEKLMCPHLIALLNIFPLIIFFFSSF